MSLCPQLILVASDLGQPVPYETMQPLQVALEDIDDNEPLFVRPPVSPPTPAPGHQPHPHRDSPACRHTCSLSCAHSVVCRTHGKSPAPPRTTVS